MERKRQENEREWGAKKDGECVLLSSCLSEWEQWITKLCMFPCATTSSSQLGVVFLIWSTWLTRVAWHYVRRKWDREKQDWLWLMVCVCIYGKTHKKCWRMLIWACIFLSCLLWSALGFGSANRNYFGTANSLSLARTISSRLQKSTVN